MKFLALEKDNKNDEVISSKLLKDEAAKVWDLYSIEKLREIYFTEQSNAVLIMECTDENEVRKLLNQLPLVKKNIIDFDIIRLHPYNGFARLFPDQLL